MLMVCIIILGAWCVISPFAAIAPCFVGYIPLVGRWRWANRAFNRYCDNALGCLSLMIPWLILIIPSYGAFSVYERLGEVKRHAG